MVDELREILHEYRCGFRGLPTYDELLHFIREVENTNDRYRDGYDTGYADAVEDLR